MKNVVYEALHWLSFCAHLYGHTTETSWLRISDSRAVLRFWRLLSTSIPPKVLVGFPRSPNIVSQRWKIQWRIRNVGMCTGHQDHTMTPLSLSLASGCLSSRPAAGTFLAQVSEGTQRGQATAQERAARKQQVCGLILCCLDFRCSLTVCSGHFLDWEPEGCFSSGLCCWLAMESQSRLPCPHL